MNDAYANSSDIPRARVALKLYPRGFLGSALAPRAVIQHGTEQSNRGYRQRDSMAMADQNEFSVPNPSVEEIYNAYILDSVTAKTMKFREQVLRVALRAFGSINFRTWFEAQYSNVSAGELHGRFLLDTVKFLTMGRRDMSLETWASIIVIDSSADPIGAVPSEVREFFGIGRNYHRDADYPSTIQAWCSQPRGLEDLIGSLHILFGTPAVV